MHVNWITSFQEWLLANQNRLKQDKIRAEVAGITPYTPSSIHADFYAERFQGTVQLWEDGQSEFYFLDWAIADRDPDYQVEVVHHDFQNEDDLQLALANLLERMSAEEKPRLMKITGYSKSEHFDPFPGTPSAVAKGRAK